MARGRRNSRSRLAWHHAAAGHPRVIRILLAAAAFRRIAPGRRDGLAWDHDAARILVAVAVSPRVARGRRNGRTAWRAPDAAMRGRWRWGPAVGHSAVAIAHPIAAIAVAAIPSRGAPAWAARASRVDGVGDDMRREGVLHRGPRVPDADHAAISRRLEQVRDRPGAPVVSIRLDALPVGVGALEDLDHGVDRHAVALQVHLDALHDRVDPVRSQRATLNGRRRGAAITDDEVVLHLWLAQDLVPRARGRPRRRWSPWPWHGRPGRVGDAGSHRELQWPRVSNGDGVRAARVHDGAEGAETAVLAVHAGSDRRVARSFPKLHLSVERPAVRADNCLGRVLVCAP
mmetsp:Transcript_1466/g.3352  ORF Transcript_1466/g.3352 Transcript_1466/m.3352 type:complete len:344 (+) Transcript_1466:285-1316(+)